MYTIYAGGFSASLDFLLLDSDEQIAAISCFQRGLESKSVVAAVATGSRLSVLSGGRKEEIYSCPKEWKMSGRTDVINNGYSYFRHSIGFATENCLIVSRSNRKKMLFAYLLEQFDIPLLEEWQDYLEDALIQKKAVKIGGRVIQSSEDSDRTIRIGMDPYVLEDLCCYSINPAFNQKVLDEIISEGLVKGEIVIPGGERMQPEIVANNLDEYIATYGDTLLTSVQKIMYPLMEINGTVDTLALKGKTPYSQQGAAINAIVRRFEQGGSYGFLIEEMGSGKTIQGLSVPESFFVRKWLRNHPGKTVRDCYMDPDAVSYRVAVVAPSHLVEVWQTNMQKLIPYADVRICGTFADVIELAKRGKPKRKELVIFSKDFLKNSYSVGPGALISKVPRAATKCFCVDCWKKTGYRIYVNRAETNRCPTCGGSHFAQEKIPLKKPENKKEYVLCPHCMNPALTESKLSEEGVQYLGVADMTSRKLHNAKCRVCGEPLWGADCKNINSDRKPYWRRMTYFTSQTKKGTATAFVPDGMKLEQLMPKVPHEEGDIVESKSTGVRRYAPAQYLKNHVPKGFFDFLILDEAHLYENASGQGCAAQQLVGRSKRTLALTGTISNGKASSMYNLLWMLDPENMRKQGYVYGQASKFIERYGTQEVTSDGMLDNHGSVVRRPSSKSSVQEKPGLSPALYVHFLLESACMLNLTDFSDRLPEYKEIPVFVKPSPEQWSGYQQIENGLKSLMANNMDISRYIMTELMYRCLYWLDKPHGWKPLVHPEIPDWTMFTMPEIDCSGAGMLLPKEEKLVGIVNQELSEGRNCFVYLEATGVSDGRILERIRDVIIENCCVTADQVDVLESNRPAALKRREWLETRASEGVRVFICNPRLVETGLDFIFDVEENGETVRYNYPTIIFYQMGYRLSTMWQAAHRSYRLIQKEECRVYYLAYENTLQVATMELMAEKQASVSAIQGKFSSGALAAMAKGVDARVKLAAALKEGTVATASAVTEMFQRRSIAGKSKYAGFEQAPDFYELTGFREERENTMEDILAWSWSGPEESTGPEATEEGEPEVLSIEPGTDTVAEKDPEPLLGGLIDMSVVFEEMYAKQSTKKSPEKRKKSNCHTSKNPEVDWEELSWLIGGM